MYRDIECNRYMIGNCEPYVTAKEIEGGKRGRNRLLISRVMYFTVAIHGL